MTTLTTPSDAADLAPAGHVPAYADRPAPAPIPFARLLKVELRKMFDTRWRCCSR